MREGDELRREEYVVERGRHLSDEVDLDRNLNWMGDRVERGRLTRLGVGSSRCQSGPTYPGSKAARAPSPFLVFQFIL